MWTSPALHSIPNLPFQSLLCTPWISNEATLLAALSPSLTPHSLCWPLSPAVPLPEDSCPS